MNRDSIRAFSLYFWGCSWLSGRLRLSFRIRSIYSTYFGFKMFEDDGTFQYYVFTVLIFGFSDAVYIVGVARGSRAGLGFLF